MKLKKLLPILVLAFVLIGASTALGAVSSVNGTMVVAKPNAYQTISGGGCSITDNSNGNINISGYTSTYNSVDQIGVTLYLQYLSGGNWYTLSSYTFTQPSSSYVTGGKYLAVSKGYYYRVSAQHTAVSGGISESGISYSESLYIQ